MMDITETSQLVAEYAIRGARWLEQALEKGVTAVRDLGGKEHVDLALERMVDEGLVAGRRMRAAGCFICMTGGPWLVCTGWHRGGWAARGAQGGSVAAQGRCRCHQADSNGRHHEPRPIAL